MTRHRHSNRWGRSSRSRAYLPRRSLRPYLRIVLITTIILAIPKTVSWWHQHWMNTPTDADSPTEIAFDIGEGETGRTIAENLETEGLIKSDFLFYWYLRQSELGHTIESGRYHLSTSMTPLEIAEILTEEGSSGEMTLTIPEGWTLTKIDERLMEMGLIESGEFLEGIERFDRSGYDFLENASSLEGYLFPDTFFLDAGNFTVESLIARLLNNFETKVLTDENLAALGRSGRTLDEIIIMASIVEREALLDEDYPLIAGVLWKRLDNDWAIEADATLLYALPEGTELNYTTLQTDTPYNGRLYKGLPPTAISNPGLTSIEATLNPVESEYWFYLNDQETGKAHYAVTNEQHNANKEEWL